jgi:phage host-nuclease inhibitor protein Gam
MEIENLLKQREALNAEIDDARTSHIRQEISDLRRIRRDLQQKLADAEDSRKLNDERVTAQIAELRTEIERLGKIYSSDTFLISQFENELKLNGQKQVSLENELKPLLSEV